jgi:aldehyde dehydrogenase (NAD+)
MKEAITAFYGENPQAAPDYGRIVNERQFDRLAAIVEADRARIVHGGTLDRGDLYIEPTLMDGITLEHASMQEELFGPLLPILEYHDMEEAFAIIAAHPKPLALYLFTESKAAEQRVVSQVSFGGGCINDTIMHVANHHLPFGGVGTSGMGAYHGKHSFTLFSHQKTIVKKSSHVELGLAFPPYAGKLERIKKFLK